MAIIQNENHAINSDKFTYSAATKSLVAEASDFGRKLQIRQIYDDACDVGITIRSVRTGKLVRYYLEHEELDEGGEDIVAWHFRPIAEDARRCPSAALTTVVILND